jgi:hypothetical protein
VKSLRNGANHGLLVLAKAVWRTTGALALEPMQKERERGRMGVYWLPAERQNAEIRAKFTTLRTEVRPKIELTEFLSV